MRLLIGFGSESKEVDIDFALEVSETVESLTAHIMCDVAIHARRNGVCVSTIYPVSIDGDAETDLFVPRDSGWDFEWVSEVAQVFWYLTNVPGADEAQVFAKLDEEWKYTDFSRLRKEIEESFIKEYDGDPEEFAREHMCEAEEGLPDHLEAHFNYASYGEVLVSEYNTYERSGRKFLYRD